MFQTNRLILRQVTINDLKYIHALNSLKETDEFNTLGIPHSILETEELINKWLMGQSELPQVLYVFGIELIDSNQLIGLIALNMGKPKYHTAEVWYKLHPKFWKMGYMNEALKKILEFGFVHLKLHRIEAGCAVENIASINVLEKVGMQREGMKRKKLPIRGEWKDNYFYAILEDEFVVETI